MAGYGEQGYGQDFYESGYNMDGVQQQAPATDQSTSWQQIPAPSQTQWEDAGGQQQAYYPPPAGYGVPQGYAQQGGRLPVCTEVSTNCKQVHASI